MSADARTLAVYAAEAESYADLPVSEVQERALTRFLALLPDAARVLDLGAGPGLQARAIADAGHDVTCWDASPAFVAAARARGLRADLHVFEDLDAEAAFDGIVASFSLLHAPRGAFPGLLGRIARALRRGGVLFLGLKLGEGEGRDRLGRFYTYYSEGELRAALDAAGLNVAEVETGRGRGLDGTESPFILIFARA